MRIRQRTAQSNANVVAVKLSVNEKRSLLIARRSQHLGLFQTITWQILRKAFGLRSIKKKIVLT